MFHHRKSWSAVSIAAALSLLFSLILIGCSPDTTEEADNPHDTGVAGEGPQQAGGSAPSSTADTGAAGSLEEIIKREVETRSRRGDSVAGPKRPGADLSPSDEVALTKAATKIDEDIPTGEKLGLLFKLEGVNSPKVLDVVAKALRDDDPEVRLQAVHVLEGFYTDDVIPLLQQAYADANPGVREAALHAAANISEPEVEELLVSALDDPEAGVRFLATRVAEGHEPIVQNRVFMEAIKAEHDDVKRAAIDWAEFNQSHAAMEVLIEGLKSEDPTIREDVNLAMEFLVSRQFKDHAEAAKWWAENRHRLDDELFAIDLNEEF